MAFLQDIANVFIKNISKTVRHFSAFVFIVMTIGVALGAHVAISRPEMAVWAIATPLVLALVSYYSTAVATLFFVLFVLVMFLLL